MRFCKQCGTRMTIIPEGFTCHKCGIIIRSQILPQLKIEPQSSDTNSMSVINSLVKEQTKINQNCPRCGNTEAFCWFSLISGEHAGIHRERTIKHFKCVKCLHTWSKSQ